MATIDAPIAVQILSRDAVFESASHDASYNTTLALLKATASHQSSALNCGQNPTSATKLTCQGENERAHSRWRPQFHLMAPTGWLNDPCAPGYDPVQGVYHVGFQWNPKGPAWGDISWGSAHSKDLLFWDTSGVPSIKPSPKYDGEAGVFTGCWTPVNAEQGRITSFYTSARILPIHHTLPYNWGSEAICMATSNDAGRTWQRSNTPTIVQGPPPNLEVTGWRDPFVAPWPSLSHLIGEGSDEALFGIVSGGVRDKGPAIFLYSIDLNNISAWSFLSTLTIAPLLSQEVDSAWKLDFGANWEVVNFLSLPDPDDSTKSHDVLVVGVEGRKKMPSGRPNSHEHTEFRRDHSQMWVCGDLVKGSTGIHLNFTSGGALDYGAMYAVNSFWDPKTAQQVAFGWIVEEDLPTELRELQGWCGLLSIPRVVQLQRIYHVVRALKSDLHHIKAISVSLEANISEQPTATEASLSETYTVTTICAMPDSRLTGLRGAKRSIEGVTPRDSSGILGKLVFPSGSSCWEVDMSFDIGEEVESIGFIITHSEDPELRTTVAFYPHTEKLKVLRDKSTKIKDICVADEEAPHTLFTTFGAVATGTSDSVMKQEALRLRAFFDVSCLELFANGRTAITTRVYPDTMGCCRIQPFVKIENGRPWTGELLEFSAWELKTRDS